MDHSPHILIGGLLIASFVGLLTGMFGVGGGFLMTPALTIILGVPIPIAVGTDLATILATSSFGVYKRRGSRTVDAKLGLTVGVAAVVGVLLGNAVMIRLKDMPPLMIDGRQLPAVTFVILSAFLLLLIWIAAYIAFDYRRGPEMQLTTRVRLFARIKIPPYMNYPSLEIPRLAMSPLATLGICTGFLSALMGIGGGVILVPALIYLAGQRTAKAAGTSLLVICVSATAAVYLKAGNNSINYYLLIPMILGGVTGTYFGTRLGLKLPGEKLKLYFIWVLVAAILMVAWKVYTMTFGPVRT